jgi:hypothetical protein
MFLAVAMIMLGVFSYVVLGMVAVGVVDTLMPDQKHVREKLDTGMIVLFWPLVLFFFLPLGGLLKFLGWLHEKVVAQI